MVKTSIIWFFVTAIIIALWAHIPYVVIPFVVSFLIAYAMTPLTNLLQSKLSMNKGFSSVCGVILFITIFVTLMTTIVPIIYNQSTILINKLPLYKQYIDRELLPYLGSKLNAIDPTIATSAEDRLKQSIDEVFLVFVGMINNIWTYTMATINAIVMIFLIPILLFYFLRDWDSMKKGFYDLFPKNSQSFVKSIFADINNVLSCYIKGQLIVCIIWVIYTYTALAIMGLDLAFILAIIAGLSPIVPIFGIMIAATASLIVGMFTFGLNIKILYILGIYLAGNIIDNSLITPKIIGDSIGISPIWIIFSVLVVGYIIGPLGMLVAIPIAGIVSVILKYARQNYKESELYNRKK
ncbi:MAG UNVERIFIED_CONTAM: AI-2E family transporter [Rickettsiaceae bacterium]|jgi:putative permease